MSPIPRSARTRRVLVLGLCPLVLALAAPPAAAAQNDFTVVDDLGRKVVLPASVRRVLSLQPEISRIIVALGAGDRFVGIDYFLRRYDHLFPIVFPGEKDLPAASNGPEDLNHEMALRLDPDIVFVSPTELAMVESLQGKTRKPVVALASMGRFAALMEEMRIVGRILGREDRAAELAGEFLTRIAAIRNRTAAVPAEKKPLVYLSFWGSLVRTPVHYEPVETAGGRNCAEGLLPDYQGSAATFVQVEQIIAWKPDLVLVQGSYPPPGRILTVEDVLGDRRLGSVPAVGRRAVRYTFGFWYWWDPALVLVETASLARLFHPDLFPEAFDLEKEGNAIFKKFYGIENAFSSLSRILDCGKWHER